MKWKGRRQSINVIDLRTYPKVISFQWYFEKSEHFSTARNPTEIFMDTDGNLYNMGIEQDISGDHLSMIGEQMTARNAAGIQEMRLLIMPPQPRPRFTIFATDDWTPTLSNSQKNSITELLSNVLKYIDKSQLTIEGVDPIQDTYLLQFAQDVVNNLG